MKAVTIKDVASRAGVSKSTVSQYLNGRYEYMSKDTKERIKKIIAELDYSPNKIARSLKQKKSTTIGVILANILYGFNTKVMRAIEDVCNEAGYHAIICNADDDPEKEKRYIEMLLSKQVDGIIAMPTVSNADLYQKLLKRNFPLVFIDRILEEVPVSCVLLDNEKAAKQSVEELVSHDYKKIAIMTMAPINNTARKERIAGFKEAIEENDLYANEEYIVASPLNEMQQNLEKLFALPNRPEALVATNDLTMMEVLKYIKDNELNIPEDIAVIGIDDIAFSDIYTPTITTVAQPAFEIGTVAAELLIDKMKGKGPDEKLIQRFEPNLIRRLSTHQPVLGIGK